MNNKLTIADLAVLLAERSGKSKTEVEQFLREFLALASESLNVDKLVRIKGMGTFKIIPVDKRESIDVNTGERFIIPAHFKYSYLPDKELKEIVNKPFAFFETTEIGDNVSFTDMEESEDESELPSEDESVEEDIPEIIAIGETELPVLEPVKPDATEIVSQQCEEQEMLADVPEESKLQVLKDNELPVGDSDLKVEPEPAIEIPFAVEKPDDNLVERKPTSRKPFYKNEIFIASLVLITFIAASVIIYKVYNATPGFVAKQTGENIISGGNHQIEMPELLVEDGRGDVDTLDVDTASMPALEIPKEDSREEKDKKPEQVKPVSKTIGTEKIETGSRLTLLSLKYYGHKIFWVYIYEANKNAIKNPNNVPVGTIVDIPAPELYGINAKDKASVSKAAALQSKILSENP